MRRQLIFWDGRLPLHYAAAQRETLPLYTALINAGQDALAVDSKEKNSEYYMEHGEEIQMPDQTAEGSDEEESSNTKYTPRVKGGQEITESNIRSWIHSKDLASLEESVWEGCGTLLLTQRTNSTKVTKLLENIPQLLNDIRDIHSASVTGDLDFLREKTRHVKPEAFNSKDKRGLTPLHKAVGLNRKEVAEFLLETVRDPETVLQAGDYRGRRPLHYAALTTTESDRGLYDWLVEAGAEVAAQDSEGKTAEDYLEEESGAATKLRGKLMEVPEAPRLGHSGRKSPSKRGFSPVKGRDSSPSKGKRQTGKGRKEEKTMSLINPAVVTAQQVEDWAKVGQVSKMETAVYQGFGDLVTGLGKVWNEDARNFIKKVPEKIKQIEEIHSLVGKSDTESFSNIDDPNLLLARDADGASPLLLAAKLGNSSLVNVILSKVPQAIKTTDKKGRTALHWAARCPQPEMRETVEELLSSKGADKHAKDNDGNEPHYYLSNDFSATKKQTKGPEQKKVSMASVVDVQEAKKTSQPEEETKAKAGVNVDIAIETKDWSKLVDVVLLGDADLLVGRKSEDNEIQEFINNAPLFKSKIDKIHTAVKEGSLKALQEHLDRRKFCLTRDKTTNINILQKAILLGHTSIARYLMNNFTELMNISDSKGRTALHYAAAMEDNNYLYKTLINRGADTSMKDKAGKTPGQYNKNKKELTKAMLVSFMNGGAPLLTSEKPKPAPAVVVKPTRKQILKSILKSFKSGQLNEKQTFTDDLDEERLLQVENVFKIINKMKEKPILGEKSNLTLPIDEETFNKIKKRVCVQSGGTLLDVFDLCQTRANFETCDHLPLLAPDPSAYQVFEDLFHPWIEQYHQHKLNQKCEQTCWGDISAFSENIAQGMSSSPIRLIELEVTRSLKDLPFAPRMTTEHYSTVEKQIKEALKHLEQSMSLTGLYMTLDGSNWSPDMIETLTKDSILFDHRAAVYELPHRQHWPVGRAVFYTKNKDLVAWINHSEHLTLKSQERRGNVRAAVSRLQSFVSLLENQLKFSWHENLGYLTLKPTNIGTGLHIKTIVDLPKLANNIKILKSLCAKHDIYIQTQNCHRFTLVSTKSIGVTEFQIVAQFFTGIKEIIEFEQ